MWVYLAHLHSALIIFDAGWSCGLRTEVLSLLQVMVFIGTLKYNQTEQPYKISQHCLIFASQWLVWRMREGMVLGSLCWPSCTEVILLWLVLLIFMVMLFYLQSTWAVYNCAQGCGFLGFNVYISSILYFIVLCIWIFWRLWTVFPMSPCSYRP